MSVRRTLSVVAAMVFLGPLACFVALPDVSKDTDDASTLSDAGISDGDANDLIPDSANGTSDGGSRFCGLADAGHLLCNDFDDEDLAVRGWKFSELPVAGGPQPVSVGTSSLFTASAPHSLRVATENNSYFGDGRVYLTRTFIASASHLHIAGTVAFGGTGATFSPLKLEQPGFAILVLVRKDSNGVRCAVYTGSTSSNHDCVGTPTPLEQTVPFSFDLQFAADASALTGSMGTQAVSVSNVGTPNVSEPLLLSVGGEAVQGSAGGWRIYFDNLTVDP